MAYITADYGPTTGTEGEGQCYAEKLFRIHQNTSCTGLGQLQFSIQNKVFYNAVIFFTGTDYCTHMRLRFKKMILLSLQLSAGMFLTFSGAFMTTTKSRTSGSIGMSCHRR